MLIDEKLPIIVWLKNSIRRGKAGHKRLDWIVKKINLELKRLNKNIDNIKFEELYNNPATFKYMKDINNFIEKNEYAVFDLIEKEIENSNSVNDMVFIEGEEKILGEREQMASLIVESFFGDKLTDKKNIVKDKLVSLFNDPTFDFERFCEDSDNSPEAERINNVLTSSVNDIELVSFMKEKETTIEFNVDNDSQKVID